MPLIQLPDDYQPQAGDYCRLYDDIVDAERCCYRLTTLLVDEPSESARTGSEAEIGNWLRSHAQKPGACILIVEPSAPLEADATTEE